MRRLLPLAAVVSACLAFPFVSAQAQTCSEAIKQSKGSHNFRRAGEKIEIPIAAVSRPGASDDASLDERATDCYPVALALHWANGRNNGGLLRVTFLDTSNQPVGGRDISAFLLGNVEVPLNGSGVGNAFGRWMTSVPAKIRIQSAEPFQAPAGVNYEVVWIENARDKNEKPATQSTANSGNSNQALKQRQQNGNEVVRVRSVTRLIGAGRVPLVQIELKAGQPFPVRDVPLQLRIGGQIFLRELSGDFTGRSLTLSLTPEMFDALEDGKEIVAFFAEEGTQVPREVWSFGKLQKSLLNK